MHGALQLKFIFGSFHAKCHPCLEAWQSQELLQRSVEKNAISTKSFPLHQDVYCSEGGLLVNGTLWSRDQALLKNISHLKQKLLRLNFLEHIARSPMKHTFHILRWTTSVWNLQINTRQIKFMLLVAQND